MTRKLAVKFEYVTNPDSSFVGPRGYALQPFEIERAVHRTRSIVDKLASFEVNVFEILGIRNLSAFVGEVFAASMILEHPELLRKNPPPDNSQEERLAEDHAASRLPAQRGPDPISAHPARHWPRMGVAASHGGRRVRHHSMP